MIDSTYPYVLPPLPYTYNALSPYIDTETMHYHHDKHFQTYINNLNKALESYPKLQKLTLNQLLRGYACDIPYNDQLEIMHNAGGVYNHSFFFNHLAPANEPVHEPNDVFNEIIINNYNSFDYLKEKLSKQAAALFGSGWTYLVIDSLKNLIIKNYKNQDTPIQDKLTPIMCIDVWEHAYYLKYKNLRADYIKNIWNVIRFPKFVK